VDIKVLAPIGAKGLEDSPAVVGRDAQLVSELAVEVADAALRVLDGPARTLATWRLAG
jgi:hypothetical protein